MGCLGFFVSVAGVLTLLTHGQCFFRRSGCRVRVNGDLPEPQPLVLLLMPPLSGATRGAFGFKRPAPPDDIIHFRRGERTRLVCPGAGNYFVALGAGVSDMFANCVSGDEFVVEGVQYQFSRLACLAQPVHTARNTGNTCYNRRASEIEIGFHAGDDFYRLLEVCFDENLLHPLYVRYDLVAEIGGAQRHFPRARNWLRGGFYTGAWAPNAQYGRRHQTATIGTILGDAGLGERYVSSTSQYFLARGHLAAKADFVYGSQHRATYYYINSVPQWQTSNSGNWNAMERDLRLYAGRQRVSLEVYAGSHGIDTLPDARGVQRELYLHVDHHERAMPVPRLLWKAAFEPRTGAGVVFVGVNNPYLTSVPREYIICRDVSGRISWLTWDKDDIGKGFSYACEVGEFRRTVDTLPRFNVTRLLV